jgi:biopolymer transport protein TolQ
MLLQLAQARPTGLKDMVLYGSTATQLVLCVLALLSLVSWAIMFAKWREFRALRVAANAFVRDFESAHRFDQAVGLARRSQDNAFTRVFLRAVQFLPELRAPGTPESTPAVDVVLSKSQVEALRYVLDSKTSDERDRLGRFIPWLATIGSASPLIGLFGTVLGIISAFVGLMASGTGNIDAVAPGVAEALIATAAALAVAIPAVFGYNLFAVRLNRIEGELEGFGSEIIAMLVREGRI